MNKEDEFVCSSMGYGCLQCGKHIPGNQSCKSFSSYSPFCSTGCSSKWHANNQIVERFRSLANDGNTYLKIDNELYLDHHGDLFNVVDNKKDIWKTPWEMDLSGVHSVVYMVLDEDDNQKHTDKTIEPQQIGGTHYSDKSIEPTRDGGSTDYYKLPIDAINLQDLIELKDMNFSVGNIFKACYRLNDEHHSSRTRELNKMKWFIERLIAVEKDKQ